MARESRIFWFRMDRTKSAKVVKQKLICGRIYCQTLYPPRRRRFIGSPYTTCGYCYTHIGLRSCKFIRQETLYRLRENSARVGNGADFGVSFRTPTGKVCLLCGSSCSLARLDVKWREKAVFFGFESVGQIVQKLWHKVCNSRNIPPRCQKCSSPGVYMLTSGHCIFA